MKKCLIISGGSFEKLPSETEYDLVIACDSGYGYAKRMGITPDIIMGDFDSAPEPADAGDIPIIRSPREKDDTDTMLAIRYALDRGCKHIILSCVLGKRFDHTFANIQSAAYIASHGGVCEIISESEWMKTLTPADGTLILPRKKDCSLSIFSLTDESWGLNVEGAKYDVTNATLSNTFPLGQSNEWHLDEVKISITSGIILIVESKIIE